MSDHQTLLCRYHYDPLDRLAVHAAADEADIRLFYQKSRLATQIQGALHRSILQLDDQLLAQQQSSGKAVETTLLATDQQRSVLQSIGGGQREASGYTAYGHLPTSSGLSSLLGFDGERRDPVTGHYLLGNGYRAFNPVLMRFNSPDSLSPFGEGGLNAYAYCQGDPVNDRDPTGHAPYAALVKNNSLSFIAWHMPRHIHRYRLKNAASLPPARQATKGAVAPVATNSSAGSVVAVASSSSSASTLANGASDSLILGAPKRQVGYGSAIPLKMYSDDNLQSLSETAYKAHVEESKSAIMSHSSLNRNGAIDAEAMSQFNGEYVPYMLSQYRGRYGSLLSKDARRKGIKRYEDLLVKVEQARRSR